MRMKVVRDNSTVKFCHFPYLTIFAIFNAKRLLTVCKSDVPFFWNITHIFNILVVWLCFIVSDCKGTTKNHITKLFLTFFVLGEIDLPTYRNIFCSSAVVVCSVFLPFPAVVFRWCPDNHMHAHTYARIYARARGFLDHNF